MKIWLAERTNNSSRIPTGSCACYCYHNRSNGKLHSHLQFIQLRRYRGIAMFRIFVRLGLLAAIGLACQSLLGQASQLTSDIPVKFAPPLEGYDYVKRVEMVPMRDGVKLYTVIVIPKGAKWSARQILYQWE
jgi:predicted acyl esterase